MFYIICNLHFNKVSSKDSLLYLLNIHIKNQILDNILDFM